MDVAAAASNLKLLLSDWRNSDSAVLWVRREALSCSSLFCWLADSVEFPDWYFVRFFISSLMMRMAFCSSSILLMFCDLVPITASISAASSSYALACASTLAVCALVAAVFPPDEPCAFAAPWPDAAFVICS